MNNAVGNDYVDAQELCRLGCKALQIEKFDSARRYFELAAKLGAQEATERLNLMYSKGYIQNSESSSNFKPNTQASSSKKEKESKGNHLQFIKLPDNITNSFLL